MVTPPTRPTATLAAPEGAGPGESDALARCVGDPERFLAECWGRAPALHRDPHQPALLDIAAVDHLLGGSGLRAPAFRLVQAGRPVPLADYTRRARVGSRDISDLIDPGKVYDLFARGATVVLQGLQRYWPPVTRFCRALEERLTHPVQANAYLTPPEAHGLAVHADSHDVFALQSHGRKQWVVYAGGADADAPSWDLTLEPGDCLYLPTGTRHAARTVDAPSLHLTIGVRGTTWGDLLRRAVEAAVADERAFLPAGYAHDPDAVRAELPRRLRALAARMGALDADELAEAAARRFWTGRAPDHTGQLAQLLDLGALDDATAVRVRPHTWWALQTPGDQVELVLADRRILLPARLEPVLRWILERNAFTVGDLAAHLDPAGRKTLVRRLVREGLLVADRG